MIEFIINTTMQILMLGKIMTVGSLITCQNQNCITIRFSKIILLFEKPQKTFVLWETKIALFLFHCPVFRLPIQLKYPYRHHKNIPE